MSDGVPRAEGGSRARAAEAASDPNTNSGLDRAVVRILAGPRDRRRRGTGTLVAPGLVLTAFHVVGDRFQDPPEPVPEGTIDLLFVKAGIEAKATLVEGCFDPDADWAILRCDPAPGLVPAPIGTLGPGERGEDARCWTFGFPEENKKEGLPYHGYVADPATRYAGSGDGPRKPKAAPALLLRADAARGDDIAGLSGGPCFAGGALVGVIRSTLTDQDELSKGHIYACPLDVVLEKAGSLLPLPDPYRGLPGLPHRPLPARPFRYLERYTEADAEIFFGRGREVRELYQLLLSDDSPPIALFFGQTGVGKSSVLDAGLVPRLRAYREPVYVRRDAARGLLGTLHAALQAASRRAAGGGPDSMPGGSARLPETAPARLWHDVERALGRPLVVILDQVEEAYTRSGDPKPASPVTPTPESPAEGTDPGNPELDDLAAYLAAVFDTPETAPRGRLLLSFRKEWLAEVQARLEARQLSFRKVPLWRLRADGIEDIVRGLSRTARIRHRWGASVDTDLPRVIRDDLLSDPESPVAPTLQILMTRLFEEADRRSPGKPALTKALYDELRRRGLLFKDFVPQQVRLVAERRKEHVESGLVDDLLEHHTTASETAAEHPIEALKKRYGHIGPDEAAGGRVVEALVEELKAAKLLSEGALRSPEEASPHEAAEAGDERTSLAHDTLAPLVRARFAVSGLPGQRARRLLEARAVEWRDGAEGRPLDHGDLDLVKRGLSGMRAVTTEEHRLLDASEAARRAREDAARAQEEAARAQAEAKRASEKEAHESREAARKAKRNLGLGALVLAAAVIVGGVVVYYQDQQTTREEGARKRAEAMADVEQLLTRADKAVSPSDALPLLCRAVEVLPPDDPRLDRIVARAVHAAVDSPVLSIELRGALAAHTGTTTLRRVTAADVSASGTRLLATLSDGKRWVIPVNPGAVRSGEVLGAPKPLDHDDRGPLMFPELSPDGRWVAAGMSGVSGLLLWEPDVSPSALRIDLPAGTGTHIPYWSDDSRAVLGADFEPYLLHRQTTRRPLATYDGTWKTAEPASVPAPTPAPASAPPGGTARPDEATRPHPCDEAFSSDGAHVARLRRAESKIERTLWDLTVGPTDAARASEAWTGAVDAFETAARPCLRDVDLRGQRVLVGRVSRSFFPAAELVPEPVLIVDKMFPRASLHAGTDTDGLTDRADMMCAVGADIPTIPRFLRAAEGPLAGRNVASCTSADTRTFWFEGSGWPAFRPVKIGDLLGHRPVLERGAVVGVTRNGQLQILSARSPAVSRPLAGPVRSAAFSGGSATLTLLTRPAAGQRGALWSYPRKEAPRRIAETDEGSDLLAVSPDGRRALLWGKEGGTVVSLVSGERESAGAGPGADLPPEYSKWPTSAALPASGPPFLYFPRTTDQGIVTVVGRPPRAFETSLRSRPFLSADGELLISVEGAAASPDQQGLSLQRTADGPPLPPVRVPTSVGRVLLATLLASTPGATALGLWPDETQLTMTLPSGAFVQVVTMAGSTAVTVSVPASPPALPAASGEPASSGAASAGGTTTAGPGSLDRLATIPPQPRTTPLVFSSNPAEGFGAFCLVEAPRSSTSEGTAPRSNVDVPLLAYVSARRENGVRPTAPWVPVVVEDLTSGTTLATFHSTEVKAMAFSPDCERLHVVGEDGVERSWLVMHRWNGSKPAWVKELSSLVFGRKIGRDDLGREATQAVPALTGALRTELLGTIEAARKAGDPAADHVWQHWFGPDAR